MEDRSEIPPGTLYMLILKTLARLGEMHGYGIAQHIQQISDDVLQVEEGSLYPALQRMLYQGLGGGGVETIGQQPAGAFLPVDAGRSEAAGAGSERVRAGDRSHCARHPAGVR